jgi:hypothetical protein
MGARKDGWAAQLLVRLLREGDGPALLGDLAEEHARRSRSIGASGASRWYRHELYASLTSVVRRRLVEWARAVPWGTTAAAYLMVAFLEFGSVWLLSLLRPGAAHATSVPRLMMEFPAIVAIAYVATTVHRSSAFLLGGMMLVVAVLMLLLSPEAISAAFAIAMLTVGPGGAVLGWLVHRRWSAVAAGIALFAVAGGGMHAQEVTSVTDPSKTIYGEKSARAPRELDRFAFLIGKWEGRGKTKLPDGTVAEYPVAWVGRYILGGMAIADEVHAPYPDGRPSFGITFRQYDEIRKAWVIEFLNVSESFLRRQVGHGSGSVAVNGRTVTITSESPGTIVREHYVVSDDDHWVYRLDASKDGGRSWDEGPIEFTFHRSK